MTSIANLLRQEVAAQVGLELTAAGDKTMWSPVPSASVEAKVPCSRSKHASVLHGQHMYLLGGRNGNVPLRDFWRYNIAENFWESLCTSGAFPGCLQEHTMVGYRDSLFVFGGEVGFSNGVEPPLWIYNIKDDSWRKFAPPKGVQTPKGRRSHTATVFQDSMYIYGGYQDLKGSTSELWAFHFESETWHLVSQGCSFEGPPPRHRHSAVLHDSALWIFGGMTDLQERADFWRFDFISRRWRPVKSKPGPGCLHSHTAVKFLSVMMLFGGERDGQTLNDMWRFHFATEFWEKLSFVSSSQPMPRAQSTAFIFSQFTTRGAVHYMGLPEQDYFGSQPEPSSCQKQQQQKKESGGSNLEVAKKYTFAVADSCLDEVEQIRRDLRRPNHFQRLDGLKQQQQPSLLRDLAKMSQFNLARLSHYCSYSMFSNESSESLATASSTASPCSIRMLPSSKSHSSQLNTNLMTGEDNNGSSSNSLLQREPVSVPNFATLLKRDSLDEDRPPPDPEDISVMLRSSDSAYTFQSYDCSSSTTSGLRMAMEEAEAVEAASAFYSSQEFMSPSHLSSRTSFSNPHYLPAAAGGGVVLGAATAVVLRRKKEEDASHKGFAQALNSPADSLFSDYQDFHSRLNQELGVELTSLQKRDENFPPDIKAAANVAECSPSKAPLRESNGIRLPQQPHPASQQQQLMLLMYVVGGREVGQVTVFKRPISIWRLDLTKTF